MEERDEIIVKTILLIISTIVISISILFFIGVSRVNAETTTNNISSGDIEVYNSSNSLVVHKDCDSFPCDTSFTPTQNPTIWVFYNSRSWNSSYFDWEFELEILLANGSNSTEIETDYIGVYEVTDTMQQTDITNQCRIAGDVPQPVSVGNLRGSKYHILAYCQHIRPSANREYMLVKYKPVNGGYVGAVKMISGVRTSTPVEQTTNDVVNSVTNGAQKITNSINNMKQEMLNKFNEIVGSTDWQNQNYTNQSYGSQNANSENSNVSSAEGALESNYGIGNGSISQYGQGAGIHSNASQMIWNTVRSCIDQTALFTLIITILFLGVIATLFNR